MIVFYPKSAFSQSPGTSDQLKAISDSEVLTHYGFNMGIVIQSYFISTSVYQTLTIVQATAALIHNLICYMVYLTNRATLPFIMLVSHPLYASHFTLTEKKIVILLLQTF